MQEGREYPDCSSKLSAHQVCLVAETQGKGELLGMEQLDRDKLVLGHSICLGPFLGHQGWGCGKRQEASSFGASFWVSVLNWHDSIASYSLPQTSICPTQDPIQMGSCSYEIKQFPDYLATQNDQFQCQSFSETLKWCKCNHSLRPLPCRVLGPGYALTLTPQQQSDHDENVPGSGSEEAITHPIDKHRIKICN